MENVAISVSLGEILFLLTFIAAIGSALAFSSKIPFFHYGKRIKKLEEHSAEQWEMNKLTCRGVQCLLEIARTGKSLENVENVEIGIRNFMNRTDE